MLTGLAFGLGVGAAIQAWRNWPATANVTADSLALVFCLGMIAAYFAGRARGRGTSSATASATAVAGSSSVASNSVNVAVVVPGAGAGSHAAHAFPTDTAPWLTGTTRLELDSDSLEGMDLSEFVERDTETP